MTGISPRRWAVLGGVATAVVLAALAGRSLWWADGIRRPLAEGSGLETGHGLSPQPNADASELDVFLAELEWVRDGRMRDIEALSNLLDRAETYHPNPPDDEMQVEAIRRGSRATASLGMITQSWMRYGPLPELRERAVANAMRMSVDESVPLRMICATMLKAVRDSDGPGALTPEQGRTLDGLLADSEVKWAMDRMLATWREEEG